jgi:hypothetical protein
MTKAWFPQAAIPRAQSSRRHFRRPRWEDNSRQTEELSRATSQAGGREGQFNADFPDYGNLGVFYCKTAFMAYVEPTSAWTTKELSEGYLAMAKDTARELKAEEWSEGLIGDSFAVGPCPSSPAPSE